MFSGKPSSGLLVKGDEADVTVASTCLGGVVPDVSSLDGAAPPLEDSSLGGGFVSSAGACPSSGVVAGSIEGSGASFEAVLGDTSDASGFFFDARVLGLSSGFVPFSGVLLSAGIPLNGSSLEGDDFLGEDGAIRISGEEASHFLRRDEDEAIFLFSCGWRSRAALRTW